MARRRTSRTVLAGLFAGARRAIYVLDERRRIVYVNDLFCTWLDKESDSLLGTRCDYHSTDMPDSPVWAAGLCPPPEVFAGRTMQVSIVRSTTGEPDQVRSGWSLPLGITPADCSGVIVFVDVEPTVSDDPGRPDVGRSTDVNWHQRVHDYHRGQGHRGQEHRGQGDRYWPRIVVGKSPAVQRMRRQMELAADCDVRTVLVGPQGSGREFLARTIHYAGSSQSTAPLVPLSCELLDAELLQTTVTAFIRRCAELETERPPALLLLEIDRLPRDAQDDLIGFMNIEELGIRTIATARESPLQLATQQRFREDLAHALSPMLITVPALSERVDDIPLLAQHLLEQCNARGGRQLSGFTADAMETLVAYPWFGDLEELAEVVTQLHVAADGPRVRWSDLPRPIQLAASAAAQAVEEDESISLDAFLATIERELIDRALGKAKGNKAHAARLLGLDRARLLRRLAALAKEEDSAAASSGTTDAEPSPSGPEDAP